MSIGLKRGLVGAALAALLLGSTAVSAKTLVYCSEGSPENFTPGLNTTGTSFDAARPVYNQLVEFERGTTKVVPGLGRLGRSQGCPAVRPQVAQKLIDTLQKGSYVFAYYPQQEWLSNSQFLAGASCSVAKAQNLGRSATLAKR